MEQGNGSDQGGGRGLDWGAALFGIILLGIGGYVLLKDTFGVDLPEISWDTFWPLLLVLLGVVVLVRAVTGSGRRSRRGR